jgi:hypothetical protein
MKLDKLLKRMEAQNVTERDFMQAVRSCKGIGYGRMIQLIKVEWAQGLERDHGMTPGTALQGALFHEDEVTSYLETLKAQEKPLTSCKAGRDGDCNHEQCPQARDGEPNATGRTCPLPHWTDDPEW